MLPFFTFLIYFRKKVTQMVTQKANYNVIFDRKNKAKTNGTGLIELVIYLGRQKRKIISTKQKIQAVHWDKKKRRCNAKNQNYVAINKYIEDLIAKIEAFEFKLIERGSGLTINRLNDFLKEKNTDNSFADYALKKLNQSSIKTSSYSSQKRSIEILSEFRSDLQFNDFDTDFIEKFNKWMIDDQQYSDWQRWKVHKDFKKFINLAIRDDIIDVNQSPYKYFKNTKPPGNHVYLTADELNKIEKVDVSDIPKMQIYKDAFLFQCYTGLRYSDLFKLKYDNFEKRDQGHIMILETMQKVNRRVISKLWEKFNGKAETLIISYLRKNNAHKYVWGMFISNTELNQALKTLQGLAGVRKNITTHVGRHTFGTLYAKETGSIFEVMKAMGISKFGTAQVYIDLSSEL